MMTLSRRALLTVTAVAACLLPVAAHAAAYPERPVTLIVPNPAGGAADSLARSFAEELSKRLNQSVVVENLGGASGAIAAQKVLRATPDGYTLLFGTTSDMVVTPIAIRSAGYSPRDFTPIAKVGITPMTLVARPGLGVSNADQLASLARKKPESLSVGTTGTGSLQAFAAVAIERAGEIDLLGVPYRGGGQIVTDVVGGQLDLAVLALPGVLQHVRAGKLAMLGVLSAQRPLSAPDMPTLSESGTFKPVTVEIWAALAGPPKLPAAVVDRLSDAVQGVLSDKDYIARRTRMGDVTPPFASPAEFSQFLRTEEERYRMLATGLKLD